MVKRQVTMYSFNNNEDGVVSRQINIDVRKYHKKFNTEDLEIAYQGFRENYRMYDLPDYFCISKNCIRKFLGEVKKNNFDRSFYYYPRTHMIRGNEDIIGTNKIYVEPFSSENEVLDRFIKNWRFDDGSSLLNHTTAPRSRQHCVYTEVVDKIGLSANDDKGYVLRDGITTLAHGHRLLTTDREIGFKT